MKQNSLIYFIKKHLLPTHLLARFVLIILLPLVVLQTSVGIFFYNRHWDAISRRLASDITGEINSVALWIQTHPAVNPTDLNNLKSVLGMEFVWQPHEILPEISKIKKDPASASLRDEVKRLPYPVQTWSDKEGAQQILVQLPEGILQVLVPRKRFFSSTVPSFLLWMMASSLLL